MTRSLLLKTDRELYDSFSTGHSVGLIPIRGPGNIVISVSCQTDCTRVSWPEPEPLHSNVPLFFNRTHIPGNCFVADGRDTEVRYMFFSGQANSVLGEYVFNITVNQGMFETYFIWLSYNMASAPHKWIRTP